MVTEKNEISLGKALRLLSIHKSLLWVLFSLVTFSILLFPTASPGHQYRVIQSIYFFGDTLPIFSVLFYLWFFLLIVLLLSKGSKWEKLLLTVLFASVVLGFWTLRAPWGKTHEEYATGSFMGGIYQEGRLSEAAEFPALYLLGVFVGQATGLESMGGVRFVISFFAYLLLAISAYLLFEKTLHSETLASVATMLLLLGNIALTKTSPFQHRFWGPIFVIFFLMLIIKSPTFSSYAIKARGLALAIYFGLVIMHLPSSLFLVFIVIGMYLILKVASPGKETHPLLTLLALLIVIFLTWQIYMATITFEGNFRAWAAYWEELLAGEAYPWEGFVFLRRSNVGESFPLWANVSRIFWWYLIFFFGSILCLIRLFSIRKQSFEEQRLLGSFVGVALLSATLFVLSPGGRESIERFLFFVPLFTIPFIVKRFSGRRILLLLIPLFVLSLPTFFSHNNTVGLDAVQAEDVKGARWLRDYSSRVNLSVLTANQGIPAYQFYLPHSRFVAIGSGALNEEELRTDINSSVLRIQQGKNTDYVGFSQGERLRQERAVGIRIDSPIWEPLNRELYQLNQIYANGFYDIFRPF